MHEFHIRRIQSRKHTSESTIVALHEYIPRRISLPRRRRKPFLLRSSRPRFGRTKTKSSLSSVVLFLLRFLRVLTRGANAFVMVRYILHASNNAEFQRETRRWKLQNHHFSSIEEKDELCNIVVIIIVIVETTTTRTPLTVVGITKSQRQKEQQRYRQNWMLFPRRRLRLLRMKKKTKKKKKEEDKVVVIIITTTVGMIARRRKRVLLPSENDRR